jgi:hypothetical protein
MVLKCDIQVDLIDDDRAKTVPTPKYNTPTTVHSRL